jgi:putative FmdB family regulatory protein
MPLYEYQCDVCGHRFERIQKFSDPLADCCPVCGGAVHKLMSSPAIQFKGSGFYITDYAKKDHAAAEKADREPSGKTDKTEKSDKGDAASKSDSAPAAAATPSSASSGSSSDSASGASSSASAPASTAASKDPKN